MGRGAILSKSREGSSHAHPPNWWETGVHPCLSTWYQTWPLWWHAPAVGIVLGFGRLFFLPSAEGRLWSALPSSGRLGQGLFGYRAFGLAVSPFICSGGARTGMSGGRGTRSAVPYSPSEGLCASPQWALLLFVTRSVTAATGNRLSLVAGSARGASDPDVTRDWRLDGHGHHSGARLDVWKALHR